MAKLPKPRFNLKAPKSNTETLIFLVFRYRGKKLLYSTGFSIKPGEWDFKSQRPVEQERRPDLWSIRQQLDHLASYCTSAYINSEYGRISVDDFKQELDLKSGKSAIEEESAASTLFEFIQQELEEMERSGMRKASLGPFHRHVKVLKKFATEQGKFNYEDVDWELRLALIDWLSSKSFQLSYGNKVLGTLRQFMERARKKKLHNNTSYQGKGWYVPRKKTIGQKAILNPQELEKLFRIEVYGFEAKVRDLFLIGAGTGQRFSDYSQYKPENFYRTLNGTPILSVISQKTDIPAKIPLSIFPWLIPILERHEYRSPKVSMQKFNYCIKVTI